ncbi:pentapeptide repeat-containing protein [Dethiosulfatarculus sandiegensis]|uniref:NACHT domain-containing protein n=1 Tax=Dethiosulfatarculus sandiegensis TaxID=1429043 RepID=A0A0D2JT43_9BACT|nr:pentapeptide repeat-containing protein [Dethiosulfatarculus sandiegensis]KIX12650.1 hypothetical protein X474_18065 [Dethiosulfatarculus sandiegensis]
MEIENLHLFFHPVESTSQEVYRLNSSHSSSPVTVYPSPRLKKSIEIYIECYKKRLDIKPENGLWDILTYWIGQLLWHDFFLKLDGSANIIGQSILTALENCQASGSLLRIMLHLGQIDSQSMAANAPWNALLVRNKNDQAYRSIVGDYKNVKILYFWADSKKCLIKHEQLFEKIKVVITFGGDSYMNEAASTLLNSLLTLLENNKDFILVGNYSLHKKETILSSPINADIWIHIGHGGEDKIGDICWVFGPGGSLDEGCSPNDFYKRTDYISSPIVILTSCGIGGAGKDSFQSITRRLLYSKRYVIGYMYRSFVPIVQKQLETILLQLAAGETIEDAVAQAQRINICESGSYNNCTPNTPLRWWQTQPVIHINNESVPLEFGMLNQNLEELLQDIKQLAEAYSEHFAIHENISRNDEYYIQPRVSSAISIDNLVRDLLEMNRFNQRDKKANPLIIYSTTGMGKSTFLWHLFKDNYYRVSGREETIPVILHFSDINDTLDKYINTGKNVTIYHLISNTLMEKSGLSRNPSDKEINKIAFGLRRLIEKGRVVLLLDAFDELNDITQPRIIKKWKNVLSPLFSNINASVIITCRSEMKSTHDLEYYFPGNKSISLLPWDDKIVKEYFEKRELSSSIVKMLMQWDEIIYTPLFASLACEAAVSGENASGDILLAELLDTIVNNWASRESSKSLVETNTLITFACQLGHDLNSSSSLEKDVGSIKRKLQISDDDVERLKVLYLHSLLRIVNGRARFGYELFRIYFAARYLCNLFYDSEYDETEFIKAISEYCVATPYSKPSVWFGHLLSGLLSRKCENFTMAKEILSKIKESLEKYLVNQKNDKINLILLTDYALPLTSNIEKTAQKSINDHIESSQYKIIKVAFVGRNLSEINISNFKFEECVFDQVNFENCNFKNCIFEKCIFTRVTFEGNNYVKTNFTEDCVFENCKGCVFNN